MTVPIVLVIKSVSEVFLSMVNICRNSTKALRQVPRAERKMALGTGGHLLFCKEYRPKKPKGMKNRTFAVRLPFEK
jgi:hypothetical protein